MYMILFTLRILEALAGLGLTAGRVDYRRAARTL
jgi:hypothetical protein